jgi:REP element-mobilizing transposase RayT
MMNRNARSKTPLRDLTTYGRGRAVRLPDCDYIGDIDIHATIRADQDEPFRDDATAAMVCENIEFYCRRLDYRLHGYCLMPDHLHVLLSPAASKRPLSYWLNVFKSYTTNQFHALGHRGRLWQLSASDHVCRDGETAQQVLTYIADNPVRAGLVERWDEWAWTKVFIEI